MAHVSRDFTYIDNVVQANHLAAVVKNKEALNQVYNVAHGERTSLNQLFYLIRDLAAQYDKGISGYRTDIRACQGRGYTTFTGLN